MFQVLVDLPQEQGWVETMVGCCQLLLLGLSEYTRSQQSLIGRLGSVIHLVYAGPMPGLVDQFHHRLEEVDVVPGDVIDTIECF